MTISLTKGQKVDLTKGSSVRKFYVGLGWDAQNRPGAPSIDVDVSACILSNASGDPQLLSDKHFVYYGNLKDPEQSVLHAGDNLTGDAAGDDESIIIDLDKIASGADEVSIIASIYQAASKGQNFGGIRNAYIHICENDRNGTELVRFDLGEDYSAYTALQFGSVYLKNGEWKFDAVGQGLNGDLAQILGMYGQTAN